MDVTSEDAKITVVGFCGLAVDGAAGVRAPVFEHQEGFYFIGDPDAPVPDDARWTRDELEELDRCGTICLMSRARPRQRGGVILYAHPAFVLPGEGRFDLHELLAGFELDPKFGCHVQYLARDEAIATMRRWAERLLDDARAHMRPVRPHGDWERALDSAERARIVAPPPELVELRVEAFVIIGAAWKALEKCLDDVLWDAACQALRGQPPTGR